MNVVASDTAPPHVFLVGFRAPPGSKFTAASPNAQQVGTFIARSKVLFDGTIADAGDVLTEDVPFADMPDSGPFKFESEIAPWKPVADVAIVDLLTEILTPAQQADLPPTLDADAVASHVTGASFGSVAIDRGSGFGSAIPRNFGWLPRGSGSRLAHAGRQTPPDDASSLKAYDAEQFDLVDEYDNAFQNGRPLPPGELPLAAGNRVRFTDGGGNARTVTVPAAPVLSTHQDGAPLDPPLTLTPRVDTVVMDLETSEFILTWRATFLWDPRFENATLEVG